MLLLNTTDELSAQTPAKILSLSEICCLSSVFKSGADSSESMLQLMLKTLVSCVLINTSSINVAKSQLWNNYRSGFEYAILFGQKGAVGSRVESS